MGVGMGLNLLLLLAMVAANILSLYHLSSTRMSSSSSSSSLLLPRPPPPASADVPEHLLRQLYTIRATITHLRSLASAEGGASSSSASSASASSAPPQELVLYSRIGGSIGSACSDHPDLLRRYMNYTPFSACPDDLLSVAEPLLLRGCQPLPRRRCFSPTVPRALPASLLPSHPFPSGPLPDSAVLWPRASPCRSFSCLPGAAALGFDLGRTEAARFMSTRSALDLTLPQLLRLARSHGAAPIRLALDVGGGTGTLAARLRLLANATVLTTTMNLGAPYSQAAALRGLVPLHAPLQQRFPVADALLDLVRTGHAVNRWIPAPVLEFLLYDADRVLRPGAFLWIDHFSCRRIDLRPLYSPILARLGYRTIKWAVADKTDPRGLKNAEVYLTALLQKPFGQPTNHPA